MLCTLTIMLSLLAGSSPAAQARPAPERGAIALPQPEAPVRVSVYEAEFRGSDRPRGIYHTLQYDNATNRPIVAVRFGLVSFDVWDEPLDRTHGTALLDLAPGDAVTHTWRVFAASRSYKQTLQTGVAFVRSVRFADGEIWRCDKDAVNEALTKIYSRYDEWEARWHREVPDAAD